MGQLIDDVAQYLQTNGIGTIGTNLFEGYMPDQPDSAVAIYETTGLKPDEYIPTRAPSFQILIRTDNIDDGRTIADSLRALLHNQYNVQFISNGKYVYRCNLIAEGGHIGQDAKGRDEFSLNFQCETR